MNETRVDALLKQIRQLTQETTVGGESGVAASSPVNAVSTVPVSGDIGSNINLSRILLEIQKVGTLFQPVGQARKESIAAYREMMKL